MLRRTCRHSLRLGGIERLQVKSLPLGGQLLQRLVDAYLEAGCSQLFDRDTLKFWCHANEVWCAL